MQFLLSDRIELLRRLNAERSRSLGAWEFEPAKNSGYITTIFGRYQSGEPAGLAYTACGDADQQNIDAEFICAIANAADDLFAERAAMMTRIATYREALGAIELALDAFADEGTPGDQPLSDGERMALEAWRIARKVLRERCSATALVAREDEQVKVAKDTSAPGSVVTPRQVLCSELGMSSAEADSVIAKLAEYGFCIQKAGG